MNRVFRERFIHFFYSLNVPPEVAVVAVLLYRGILHIFPFVTSILLYRPLFTKAKVVGTGSLPEQC